MKKSSILSQGYFEARMAPNNYWRTETRMKRKKLKPIPKGVAEKIERLWREMNDRFPKRK